MHEVADVGRRASPRRAQQLLEAVQRARGGILGRGQALVEVEPAALGVDEDEVGEGAADVETDPVALARRAHPATSASTRATAERARITGRPPAAARARAFMASE